MEQIYADGSLVPTDDLIKTLDWDLLPSEVFLVESTLVTLSQEAITLGANWCTPAEAGVEGELRRPVPRLVQMKIIHAARRYIVNDLGLVTSRAGEETMGWDGVGDKAGSPYFTEEERRIIAKTAGRSSFQSVDSRAWAGVSGTPLPLGYVPAAGSRTPFHYFADGDV